MSRANDKTVRSAARVKGPPSPVGSSASGAARRRAEQSPGYRREMQRLAAYEKIARIVIRRRLELGLSQKEVAERMRTSNTAISRIESGQHATKQETLARLAQALEMRYVHGFEISNAKAAPIRELVSV